MMSRSCWWISGALLLFSMVVTDVFDVLARLTIEKAVIMCANQSRAANRVLFEYGVSVQK